MEVNSRAGDIIIRFDNQQEATALLAVLSGQISTDQRTAEFGNWLYGWFFEQVRKLSTNFDKELAGITRPISPPSYVPPRQGTIRSFP